jgi:hypothetical protein
VQIVDARELEETFQPIISLFKTVADLGIVVQHAKIACIDIFKINGVYSKQSWGNNGIKKLMASNLFG